LFFRTTARRLPVISDFGFRKVGGNTVHTALLALVRDAEHTGDEYQYIEASRAAEYLVLLLLTSEPLYSVRYPFFNYLRTRFFSRSYSFSYYYYPLCKVIDIDLSIASLKKAIQLATHFNIKTDTCRERARLVFWMWRTYIFGDPITFSSKVDKLSDSDAAIQNGFHTLRMRLKNDDRRHPRWY